LSSLRAVLNEGDFSTAISIAWRKEIFLESVAAKTGIQKDRLKANVIKLRSINKDPP
jgi:hypothetical protein